MSVILCDFDGTISTVDTLDYIIKIVYGEKFQKDLEQKFLNGEKEDLREILSSISPKEMIDILERGVRNVIDESFRKFYEKCQILNPRVEFYIISSGFKQIITHFLPYIREDHIFSNDFYSNDTYINKVEIIKNIMSAYTRKKSVYIGDGISDFSVVVQSNVDELYVKKDSILHDFCKKERCAEFKIFENFDDIDISNEYLLLSPGVVRAEESVFDALKYQHTYMHRQDKFRELYKIIDTKIKNIACPDKINDFITLITTGSGTTSMDEVLNAHVDCLDDHEEILILSNGMFGERWKYIASYYSEPKVRHVENKWGEPFDLNEIQEILKEHKSIKSVVVVHCDTSVGILNNIHEIGKVVKNINPNITYIVDAVSTFGGIPIDMVKSQIDFLITNPNKAIASFMGVGIIICKHSKMKGIKSCHYSLDLKRHYENALKYETCNTVSISSLKALDEALNIISVKQNYDENILMFNECYHNIKYKKLLTSDVSCPCIITIIVENANDMIKYLYENGIIVYECKGKLNNKGFQISFYGQDGTMKNIKNIVSIINNY